MRITFLGTAAAEGFPDAFCGCESCEDARREGGRSLRYRSAAMINDDLLIDFGPDLTAASMRLGIPLTDIPYALQTHPHNDHLDQLTFFSRSTGCQVQKITRTDYFCSGATLRRLDEFFGDDANPTDVTDRAFQERLNLTITMIASWQQVSFGPYRVQTLAANHGGDIEAMLFAIADERGGQVLYGTDTGPLPSDTWQRLAALGWSFDVVVLDHTFGFAEWSTGHLNAEQFMEEVASGREAGAIGESTTILATHLAHHSNPAHHELARRASERGYDVAYDGLTVDTAASGEKHVANVRVASI